MILGIGCNMEKVRKLHRMLQEIVNEGSFNQYQAESRPIERLKGLHFIIENSWRRDFQTLLENRAEMSKVYVNDIALCSLRTIYLRFSAGEVHPKCLHWRLWYVSMAFAILDGCSIRQDNTFGLVFVVVYSVQHGLFVHLKYGASYGIFCVLLHICLWHLWALWTIDKINLERCRAISWWDESDDSEHIVSKTS